MTTEALRGACLAAMFVAASASGQQDPLAPPANGPKAEGAQRAILRGAIVRTRADAEEAPKTIVIVDGLVRAVLDPDADASAVAPGAKVFDLTGLRVYPAFVDPFVETDAPTPRTDRPGAHWNPRITPDRRAIDGGGLDGKTAEELRKLGFAVAGLAPKGGLFRGAGAVVATAAPPSEPSGRRPRTLLADSCRVVGFRSGDGFRRGGGEQPTGPWPSYPNSLMGAIALVRQTFIDASTPTSGASCLDAMAGDPPIWFDVEDELDLLRAAKIADEFALAERNAVVFVGSGYEFRRLDAIAETLLEPAAFVKGFVVPLNFPDAPNVGTVADQEVVELRELMNWEQAPTNLRRLHRRGLSPALTTARLSDRGVFLERLRLALKDGLTEAEALAALTTTPAALLGLDDALGAIEPEFAANLIVADGPIFEEKTKIRDLWIDGARHEINPAPKPSLEGTWVVEITPPPPLVAARRFEIDAELKTTLRLDDKSSEAKNATFANGRFDFTVDHAPLGAPGVFGFSAVVDGDVMTGVGSRADGTSFRFVATRDAAASKPASRPSREPESRPETQPESRPESAPVAEAPPPEDLPLPFGPFGRVGPETRPAVVHVVGGTVWTCGPQGVIENGYVVVRDGKVAEVGRGRPTGAADLVIDAAGRHVTPGIVDCHSHTGVSGSVNEGGQAVTAEVRIEDVTDPDDVSWYRQLGGGVTAVNQLHGSANAIGGQNCVVKVRFGCEAPDDMHIQGAPTGIKFALGENPRQANGADRGDPRYPQTRMGVEALIRDRFFAAKAYAAARAADPTGVRRDLELDALAEILEGKRLVHCHSYRQDEILMLCRVADEFGFKIGTFQHVLEGYKVADAIAKHALGGSSFADWWAYKVEVWDGIPHNGSLMREQGVVVSFNSDSDELARRLNGEASKAVKYGGTPEHEALKFVTLNAALQLGVGDRIGSLEVGKDADFAVWSAPPLSSYARCEETWIDGVRKFSLEDDAARRDVVRSERARLIQKALRHGGGPKGGEKGGRGKPSFEDDEVEDAAARATRLERLRALFRTGERRWMTQGDCGCGVSATEANHDR